MRTAGQIILLACAAALLSCEGETYNVAEMVDPKVTEISADGREAKVNIGMFDEVHVGQRLWVVRGNRPVGILVVRDAKDYSSDCVVVASKKVSEMPVVDGVELANIHPGDLVVRTFKGITQAGALREKVPRMVPVPYEVPEETVAEVDKELGGPEARREAWKKIPRDQVEAWRRRHPYVGKVRP
ncbi:MAG TPA: hypothetical protein VMZ92_07055 [Planctomycetota bacterium]|nr:hypothetical protein [Planctomycetota bacterium]